jgi:PPM family protein phosphatase
MSIAATASVSDTGRRRRRNEDAFVVQPPLFAVADGMGGAQAGEIASRLAAEALRESPGDEAGEERVAALIREANRRVYARSREDSAATGMGTTMTVAVLEDGLVRIGHVGDSRAYLIRNGLLEQLTEDHSLVAELMRDGKLSPEEAETHPQRSVITRVLGTEPDVDVDTFSVAARPGDLFLLCSDGLTTMVGDEMILRIVQRERRDLTRAARALVSAANGAGGEDNITVVFFAIAEDADVDQTMRMPTPVGAATAPEDEDTLSGIEAVPAVGTMVASADELEEALRAAEHEPAADEAEDEAERTEGGGSFLRRALVTLAVLVLLAAIAVAVYWGLAT